MPLEIATHLSGLNPANPTGGDPVASGDDHIRLLKTTLKNSFPNISSPVTSSPTALNTALVPPGCILPWYAAVDTPMPTGWALCDGANGTPDLRGRVMLGSSTGFPKDSIGGSTTAIGSSAGSHSHTMSNAGFHNHGGSTNLHVLTVAQMPSHNHPGLMVQNVNEGTQTIDAFDGGNHLGALTAQGNTGGNQGHAHVIPSDGIHAHAVIGVDGHVHSSSTLQPYFSINFIMKLAYS